MNRARPRRRQFLGFAAAAALHPAGAAEGVFDIRTFGAIGNGTAIDTAAVNGAIAAASAAGGGIVRVPAGTYACYSIHLQSRVTLHLAPGAVILGAVPRPGTAAGYDPAEPNGPWEKYQDFGHNHWHNSLIWGENLHDVAITGPGLIWGRGLSRGSVAAHGLPAATAPGAGDKAIALKTCRNVALRGFGILAGGHFGILATGIDDLVLDGLTIDTNRDGVDIDCCRNVRIAHCRVNSPWDDGICLKSSFALGTVRATENVGISHCHVTGLYRPGTMLNGSFRRFARPAADNGGQPTGRIKCGTESVGGFRDIAISDCRFEGCRGLAVECVDGGHVENITVRRLVMRDIRNAPIFLRLGARMRGPPGRPVGTLRRIVISDVDCEAPRDAMPAIVRGLPGHPVEHVLLRNIRMVQKGGGSAAAAGIVPPELARGYPEPGRVGTLPAQGLFIRHARAIELDDVRFDSRAPDARAFVWLGDVAGADVRRLRLPRGTGAPVFRLEDVAGLRVSATSRIGDGTFRSAGPRPVILPPLRHDVRRPGPRPRPSAPFPAPGTPP